MLKRSLAQILCYMSTWLIVSRSAGAVLLIRVLEYWSIRLFCGAIYFRSVIGRATAWLVTVWLSGPVVLRFIVMWTNTQHRAVCWRMPTVSQEQPEQMLPHCVIMKYTVLLADYEDRILAFYMERFQAPPSGSGCSANLAVKADWTPLSSDTCRMRLSIQILHRENIDHWRWLDGCKSNNATRPHPAVVRN